MILIQLKNILIRKINQGKSIQLTLSFCYPLSLIISLGSRTSKGVVVVTHFMTLYNESHPIRNVRAQLVRCIVFGNFLTTLAFTYISSLTWFGSWTIQKETK